MELPTNFTRDVIMKAPTSDIMGSMTRSILTLGSDDKEKESLEIPNVLRQSMQYMHTMLIVIMKKTKVCIFIDLKKIYLLLKISCAY